MPRDGSNIYSQPFPDVVEDTTIESTVYNGFTNDVAQDLNAPRPVVAGGTGGATASDARFNLATEAATQLVTNYDDHVWVPGSFRSTSSATNAPVASHAFGGWCYIGEALANPPTNQNVVVHAFDFDALANTALLYTRQKKAGVWSDWNITTTEDNQSGARQAIYAAPFDALAYNGMQINGSMDVSQEKGTAGIVNNGYGLDGWRIDTSGTMGVTLFQATDLLPAATVVSNSILAVSVQTAQASIGSADFVMVRQLIEGYRVSRLAWGTPNAQSITLGFWTGHQRTGTHSGSIRNGAGNRACVFTYTQNASGVFEYKTVTIPGCTDGTWLYSNGVGMTVTFAVASGTNYMSSTPGVWQSVGNIASTGQVNGVAATSDVFRLTGVVVLPGIEAPSAERSPLIMRPYDQELLTCQRYFQQIGTNLRNYAAAANAITVYSRSFSTPMRIAPTAAIKTAGTQANLAAFAVTPVSETDFFVSGQAAAAGDYYRLDFIYTLDARL